MARLPSEPSRVRLEIRDGEWEMQIEPLGPPWQGLSLDIWPHPFENPAPHIKDACRTQYRAAWEALTPGYDDMLLITGERHIAETTRMNLFWLTGGRLRTPDDRCMPLRGIARELVCRWSPWPVETGFFTLADIGSADVVFGTNAVRGVVWIRRIGNREWTDPSADFMAFRQDFERKAYG